MATIFASMAKGKVSQTTNPSLGGSSSTPPPTTFTPSPPPIPTPQQSIPIDMFNAEVDYASGDWDHDTDTLASFVAWKSELDHTTATNDTTERLLEPICRFIRAEMTHQFAKQSVTVKIPGLKEMKESVTAAVLQGTRVSSGDASGSGSRSGGGTGTGTGMEREWEREREQEWEGNGNGNGNGRQRRTASDGRVG